MLSNQHIIKKNCIKFVMGLYTYSIIKNDKRLGIYLTFISIEKLSYKQEYYVI